jgi:hypothetical protein
MLPVSTMNKIRSQAEGPRNVPSERRSHRRLRDLCDEVLASYRVASDRDVISETDRAAARMMLAQIAPLATR